MYICNDVDFAQIYLFFKSLEEILWVAKIKVTQENVCWHEKHSSIQDSRGPQATVVPGAQNMSGPKKAQTNCNFPPATFWVSVPPRATTEQKGAGSAPRRIPRALPRHRRAVWWEDTSPEYTAAGAHPSSTDRPESDVQASPTLVPVAGLPPDQAKGKDNSFGSVPPMKMN